MKSMHVKHESTFKLSSYLYPSALVSGINKTAPSGIDKTTQLRLDQLLASWLGDQVVFILSAYIIANVKMHIALNPICYLCQTLTTETAGLN